MELIIYSVILLALGLWIAKEHKNATKHREGKKSLNLSGHEWIKVLERSIEESWKVGIFYGFLFGIIFLLFLQSLKDFIL